MPEVAPLLVSLHIPKTGGGTLLEVLSTKFGDRLQRAYQPPRPGSSRSDSDGWPDIPDPQCIHGHAVVDRFGELIASCPTSRWITFLREPLASAVSFYHHMRRHVPWGPNRAAFDDRGLQHYVLHQYNHDRYTKNVDRCRAFAGEFFFVGVNERFDESLLVLYRLLDWDPIPYRPRNVGSYENAALEPHAVEEFRRLNRADYGLYREVLRAFDQRVRDYGPGFSTDLRKLRRQNAGAAV